MLCESGVKTSIQGDAGRKNIGKSKGCKFVESHAKEKLPSK